MPANPEIWLVGLSVTGFAFAGVWAGLLVAQLRLRRDGTVLAPHEPESASAASVANSVGRRCSLIVPTRNAAATIEASLVTVLAQDDPDLEIILVDDRSTDGTSAVLTRLAAGDPRVRVMSVDSLPSGWLGKSHALWRAAATARGDWLLFVDDDCTLHPAAARTVVTEARSRDVGLLTLWPRHDGRRIGEDLVIPLCGGIIAMWYGRRPGEGLPFANGQFLLMSRSAYDAADGHRGVRDALIEDVVLAQAAARKGIASFVGSGRDLVTVRMYDGLASAMDGWSRIFVGALRSGWRIVASIIWLLAGNLLPFVGLPWLLLAGPPAGLGTTAWAAAVAGTVTHLIFLGLTSWGFWSLGGCRRRWLAAYPISVGLVAVILARAGWALCVRRRVRWRHTDYRIDRHARIQPR